MVRFPTHESDTPPSLSTKPTPSPPRAIPTSPKSPTSPRGPKRTASEALSPERGRNISPQVPVSPYETNGFGSFQRNKERLASMGVNNVNGGASRGDEGPSIELDDYEDVMEQDQQPSPTTVPLPDPANPSREEWQMVNNGTPVANASSEEKLLQKELKDGICDKPRTAQRHVLAKTWFSKWSDWLDGKELAPPGPVDNSAVLQTSNGTGLAPGLLYPDDFLLLSAAEWRRLVERYGLKAPSHDIQLTKEQKESMANGSSDSQYENATSEPRLIGPPAPPAPPAEPGFGTTPAFGSRATNSSYTPSSSYTNGKTTKRYTTFEPEEKGTIGAAGLSNLGNTCFMNSALQCLSNTSPLTRFFLGDLWKDDINEDNPLGMKGEIAEQYAYLIRQLWDVNGPKAFSPYKFKSTIGKFNSMFQGYGQQDSQELLNSLLDGLHEDLNRIKKKPYIETPDMDEKGDEEIAGTLWDIHCQRNSSVIVDLFQGQYKSRLECPECGKSSTTFDPFMFLSIPIPERRTKSVSVFAVPGIDGRGLMRGSVKYVKETVPFNATIKALKVKVAEEMGWEEAKSNPRRLMVVEVYQHKLWKVYEDEDLVSAIKDDDQIFVVDGGEPNWEAFGVLEGERKKENVVYVPVYWTTRSSYSISKEFGVPLVVALPAKIGYTVSGEKVAGRTEKELQKECEFRIGKAVYREVVRAATRYAVLPLWRRVGSEVGVEDVVRLANLRKSVDDELEMDDGGAKEDLRKADEGREWEPVPDLFGLKLCYKLESKYGSSYTSFSTSSYSSWFPGYDGAPSIWLCPVKKADLGVYEGLGRKGSVSSIRSCDGDGDRQVPALENGVTEAEENGRPGEQEPIEDEFVDCDMPPDYTYALDLTEWKEKLLQMIWKTDVVNGLFGNVASGYSSKDMFEYETVESDSGMSGNGMEKKHITLQDCFDEFRKEETLGEDNAWYCPKCKEHRQAKKKLDIWRLPDIMVFNLKRFSHSGRSIYNRFSSGDKIEAFVNAPINGLDLRDVVIGPQKDLEGEDLVYDLFAVSNHSGYTSGGHYTAYGKNPLDQRWYKFDDSRVYKVEEKNVMTDEAYLLFYKRRKQGQDDDSLKSLVEEIKQRPPPPVEEPKARPTVGLGHTLGSAPAEGLTRRPDAFAGLPPSPTDSNSSSTAATKNNSPLPSPKLLGEEFLNDSDDGLFNLDVTARSRSSTGLSLHGGGLSSSFPARARTPLEVGWGYGSSQPGHRDDVLDMFAPANSNSVMEVEGGSLADHAAPPSYAEGTAMDEDRPAAVVKDVVQELIHHHPPGENVDVEDLADLDGKESDGKESEFTNVSAGEAEEPFVSAVTGSVSPEPREITMDD
ncbi:Ubiquitin carboxyl-terminal hydrolase 15 [Rhizophlyctis rosea]|uniref:ubiquitinyl hydrolase 1 n=1 Tax=Rhizophlyctis rosea TaxID=64517 RepID=A0AAD5SDG8_9FUNG|nr:Ubiquitin carboxyl-terminal hydrolase 15 [Rhizophlyctis rosea]